MEHFRQNAAYQPARDEPEARVLAVLCIAGQVAAQGSFLVNQPNEDEWHLQKEKWVAESTDCLRQSAG
jgi:hypothetical protein